MTTNSTEEDVKSWLSKDQPVGQRGPSADVGASTAIKPGPALAGEFNFRMAKLGGMMLVSIYFPFFYLLTGLNSLRDWFVFLVVVAVTGAVCSLKPFRPAFERSIRYFTALMITAISLAVALVVYKVFF